MDLEWMKFYPEAFIVGTVGMSAEETGAYQLLLCFQWDLRRLPKNERELAAMARVTVPKLRKLWAGKLGTKFDEDDDGYFNRRLEKERLAVESRSRRQSEAGKKAAAVRWGSESHSETDANRNANRILRVRAQDRASIALSSSISSSLGEGGAGGEGFAEPSEQIVDYLNDLAGCRYGNGADAEYLRERLEAGVSVDDCCRVVEAAVVCGKLDDTHPRRIFSDRWFGELLTLRTDPARWKKHAEKLEELLDSIEPTRSQLWNPAEVES